MPVWQKAMDLAEQVFTITEPLPRKEDYGLTSQIRRSALSVSANIAEGFGRHLIYGFKVHYFTNSEFTLLAQLIANVWEELNKLIASLRPKP
jgi:23S rRNA-intervening sequence protein